MSDVLSRRRAGPETAAQRVRARLTGRVARTGGTRETSAWPPGACSTRISGLVTDSQGRPLWAAATARSVKRSAGGGASHQLPWVLDRRAGPLPDEEHRAPRQLPPPGCAPADSSWMVMPNTAGASQSTIPARFAQPCFEDPGRRGCRKDLLIRPRGAARDDHRARSCSSREGHSASQDRG